MYAVGLIRHITVHTNPGSPSGSQLGWRVLNPAKIEAVEVYGRDSQINRTGMLVEPFSG